MAAIHLGAVGAVRTYTNNTVFGYASDSYGNNTTIIGANNITHGDNNLVFGAGNSVHGNNNIVIGNNIACFGDDQIMISDRPGALNIPLSDMNLARLMIFAEIPGLIPDAVTHICTRLHNLQITREQLLVDIRDNLRSAMRV